MAPLSLSRVLPSWSTAVVVLAAGIVVALSLARLIDSPLAWSLLLATAAVAALIAARSVARGVRDPERFPSQTPAGDRVPGDLRALARTVEWARAGFLFSQAVVLARVANAFLEKVRLVRGLSPNDIEACRVDPAMLTNLIGDPQLVDFLLTVDVDRGDAPRGRSGTRGGEDFGLRLTRILARMEAWG